MIHAPDIKLFIDPFKKTSGAFSVSECIALFNIAINSPAGLYVELGSHKGKSSQAIALGVNSPSKLILVEPEFKDEEWAREVLQRIEDVITGGVELSLMADYSLNVIPALNDISFIFIDSGFHDDMVMEEVKLLEDKIIKNGVIAFHDYKNQFTAVSRAYDYLVSTGKYDPIEINWQPIFDYVKENHLEEGNNSWHLYPELGHPPNFVGALRKK